MRTEVASAITVGVGGLIVSQASRHTLLGRLTTIFAVGMSLRIRQRKADIDWSGQVSFEREAIALGED